MMYRRFSTQQGTSAKSLTYENMNTGIKMMEYAVRGPVPIRATEITNELQQGAKKPFTEVLKANIGDSHALGQTPITFIRQVLALVLLPELQNDSKFPDDVKKRAKEILACCRGGSIGAYSDTCGINIVRRRIAEYIEQRDGVPSNCDNILLGSGASEIIKSILSLLNGPVEGKRPGVMIPIPQYPLYAARIVEFGMEQIGYYLKEENNWSLETEELERAYREAAKICRPRAIVVINPGNPTGQVLTLKNVQSIIKFAHKYNLFIFADEVYQDNIYAEGSKFHSFKRVMTQMGSPFDKIKLASFMSCSKGYIGECGLRGGYSELVNVDSKVMGILVKSLATRRCPGTIGQTTMFCLVNPPKPGEPSYEKFKSEKEGVLKSLAERAKMVADTFNSIPGMSCNAVQGAMYAFPQLKLPEKAIAKAKTLNQCPSTFYVFQLLENTGICVVPGVGFGQQPGTYHFRTTILPQSEKLKNMMAKIKEFHLKFLEEYK
ncbi:glycerol-3-phosphate O-acyltransferase 2 [Homalodisca vitripennis]|nr:glycerol-3-phosphate O-acyltransferase 2 [Homalodisca vitripennis]